MADPLRASAGAPVLLSWTDASGIGARASNQDAMGAAQQDDMVCFVVADGAGGHEGGEVASRMVVDAVIRKFLGESSFGTGALRSYVEHASAALAQGKLLTPRQRDMSATVATVLIDQSNGRAVWAHLGDTRIYMFRNGRLRCVTRDHSVTQQLIDAGYAKADELRSHPQRNLLFAAIGAEGDTHVAASEDVTQLQDRDAFLICTDGFWEWVLEADMERTLAAATSSGQWISAMETLAEANVGAAGKARDNHSVFAIWVGQPGAPR